MAESTEFDPNDESRYERDDDRLDELLSKVHTTADMLESLFAQLSDDIDTLETEIRPKRKGVKQ
jgi:hypothetical protein